MLKVVHKGMYSSIQDLGRYTYRSFGVPVSGAMDQFAARMANLILTNDSASAVLEVTYNGSFEFLHDTLICVTGADLNATLNDQVLTLNTPIAVGKNSLLKFTQPNYGLRAYVAVKGGFLNKPVLGSRSLFNQITKKAILAKDDEIFYEPINAATVSTYSHPKLQQEHFESSVFEVFKGPEYELLDKNYKDYISRTTFTISSEHNRMGYRLQETRKISLASQLTVAMLPGTVQLTPSGGLIILMRDCGVTGGYPRILQLTDMAINRLAQKSTKESVQFKIVDLPV